MEKPFRYPGNSVPDTKETQAQAPLQPGFLRISLGFSGFLRVPPDFSGFLRISLYFSGFLLVSLCFPYYTVRIRSRAFLVFSWDPKAVRRKKCSPQGPKPEPGVPTTLASFRR